MYKVYIVPDATDYVSSGARARMYAEKQLLWDPLTESDAYAILDPKLKGEVNKADSFQFTILPANIHYSDFHKRKTVIIIYDDSEWIFEGVVSDCPVDFYKQRKVTCSGALSYLCDSVQAPDEKNSINIPTASANLYVTVPTAWYNNANPHSLGWYERGFEDGEKYTYTLSSDTSASSSKTYYYVNTGDGQNHSGSTYKKVGATKENIRSHIERLLAVHNSQVDPFKTIHPGRIIGDSTEREFKSSNYRETWSAFKSDIIDEYGRYVTVRLAPDYELTLNYLELWDMDPDQASRVKIEFGNNMIEMAETDDSDDDLFTVLVPVGKNALTLEKLSGHSSPAYSSSTMINPYVPDSWGGNKRYVVVSPRAVETYGFIVKTQTFSDADTAAELYNSAVEYIKNNFDYHVEYDVKGIDMFILGENDTRIVVGKKCRVQSKWHGVDDKDLYVISAEHDLMNPENDTYKIGIPTSDREAKNKTLTGQTTSSSTSGTNTGANLSSGLNQVENWLQSLFDRDEDWLLLNSKFRNEVESENGMFKTKFEQSDEHINIMATKIFGIPGTDDCQNQDAGFIPIPKPPARDTITGELDYYDGNSGKYKVPVEHNWYEKNAETGIYSLSTRNEYADPNVQYYVMRLAARASEISVGPGGIKARVDGNYETSTYCSSWIEANEDAILALTGHLYVDEDGHVHTTSGSGVRTDHHEAGTTLKYIQVEKSTYTSSTNPKAKHWYERALDETKAWKGQGQPNNNISPDADSYYVETNDETVDRNKYYYYLSNIRESFVAEYGVYDEDNLTAGVMARVINNPTYTRVPESEVHALAEAEGSPRAQGWFVYEESRGTYGLTLDTEVTDEKKPYYTVTNNMQSWTYLNGDHIVIGKVSSEYVQVPSSAYAGANPHAEEWYERRANGTYFLSDDTVANTSKIYYQKQATYNGMDEQTQSRIARYIEGHNLDGTITEIASDVLYVHALFADYLDVLSQKVFGVDDQDSGFVAVTNTAGKIPVKEGWYELVNGKYILTSDDEVKPGKTYYARRITERISHFNVDENGIHGIVQGNYDRSINSASWIEANEDQILAITGHIYVDENGQIIIKNGAGFRTGHTDPITVHKYVQIPKSEYSGSPSAKGWYERNLNENGKWYGEGKSNQQTTDSFYKPSNDGSANLGKYYYKLATTEEEFSADYGVYDENNLRAGIVTRMINNPEYIPMPSNWYSGSHNPSAEGLYVETNRGSMAATTDTSIDSGTTYYRKSNSATGWTAVKGEHVVVGYTDSYTGLDEVTKAKVNKYVGSHNLDGTLTEIASDVVTVNALIAKYISADSIDAGDIEVGTWLRANFIGCNDLYVWGSNSQYCGLVATRISSGNYFIAVDDGTGGSSDWNLKHCILNDSYNTGDGPSKSSAFSAEVVGDEVTISYKLMDKQTKYFSFIKPASLGSVTWSSGNKTLTAKTVGGANFMVGQITPFQPATEAEARSMANAVFLDTRTTGYETIYGINYTYKKPTFSDGKITGYTDTSGHTMLFKTPKNRYPDAVSTIKTYSNWAKGDGETIELGYSGSANVFAQYKTETQFDAGTGAGSGVTNLGGVTVTSPGVGEVKTYYEYDYDGNGDAEGTSMTHNDTLTLGYSDEVTVKGRHQDGLNQWHEGYVLTVKSKADRYNTGYDAAVDELVIDPSSNKSLGYSDSVTVKAKVKKRDGTYAEKSIKVTSPADNSVSISTDDIDLGSVNRYSKEPSANQKLTTLRDEINTAISNGQWVKFKVSVGSLASKTYKMDFT